MNRKFEMRIGDSPEDGIDTVVNTWHYYCGSCKQKRKAVIFGSGHVLDIEESQTPDKENLVVDGGKFKNLYLIVEARDEKFRLSQAGIQAIKTAVGRLHADQFHGGGKVIIPGKN